MPVPVGMSPGRTEPRSPYYEEQEETPEPDPDAVYEREIERQIEREKRIEAEARHVTGEDE